jgi:YD repeat-containing protein
MRLCTRTYTYDVDPTDDGWLDAITDPLSQTTTFDLRDGAGRVLETTRPDATTIVQSYDANGNLATLAPPGQPLHAFDYSNVELRTEYAPPNLGAGGAGGFDPETEWDYDDDRQLEKVTRPDVKVLDYKYDDNITGNNTGRLETIENPSGDRTYGYDPNTGQLDTIATPAVSLALGYDGHLLTSQSWTVSTTLLGSVEHVHDDFFEVVTENVNGADPIAFTRDNDGLITGAGTMLVTPDPQHGMVKDTTLGLVTDAYVYNAFGELQSYVAFDNGLAIYDIDFEPPTDVTRDALGRIVKKVETINSQTTVYEYTYDSAGRLDIVKEDTVVVRDYDYDVNGNRL